MSRNPTRRAFLAAFLGGALSSCGWDGGETLFPRLVSFSRVNDWISARLFSSERLAPKYPLEARSSSFPAYHISAMVPTLEAPSEWRLEVGGMVDRPRSFSLDDIRSHPATRYTVEHFCVEGWSAIATWTGTPLRTIAELVGVRPEARYVRFDSFDSGYYNGWDMPSAMHPETILAYRFNDEELMPDHGAPLRLYAPHKLGYKLTKYLTRITFTDVRPGGYWEDQGYPWFAGV